MGNKLEYSLGLTTGNFGAGILAANQGLELFRKAVSGIGAGFGQVFAQIERGGALKDLSNRLAEPVGNLVQFQEAFKQVGLAGENVGPMLSKFQKSLSGVGDAGENTEEAFRAIGLSVKELSAMSSPDALLKVFKAFAELDKNKAAGLAAVLFGRDGAGNMLQIARNAGEFTDAMKEAAALGAIFEKNADTFNRFGQLMGSLKIQAHTLFADLAAEITPFLNLLGQQVKDHDFSALGDTLGLALKAGIQDASFFLADEAKKWGDEVRKQLGNASDTAQSPGFWKKTGKGALGVGAGLLAMWDLFGGALGVPGADEMAVKRIEQAEKLFKESGLGGGVVSDLAEVLTKSPEQRTNEFRAELNRRMALDKAANEAGKPGVAAAAGNIFSALGAGATLTPMKVDANALQMAGLWNSPSSNDSSAIRVGIQQLVKEVRTMSGLIRGKWGYGYEVPTNQ